MEDINVLIELKKSLESLNMEIQKLTLERDSNVKKYSQEKLNEINYRINQKKGEYDRKKKTYSNICKRQFSYDTRQINKFITKYNIQCGCRTNNFNYDKVSDIENDQLLLTDSLYNLFKLNIITKKYYNELSSIINQLFQNLKSNLSSYSKRK